MSLIIKGMKLPLAGDVMVCALIDGKLQCSIVTRGKPIEWCEALEIPTPHGRLIDADTVEKRLQKYWYEEYPNQEASYHRAFMDSNDCVKDLPTIIEAEVSE